ncbi:MAG: inositol monophosphatase [Eubacterium sp.]|nr:inositol monophosphatase [Eubacterium sp.]
MDLIEQIEDIVRECGEIILKADRSDAGIDAKSGKANFVTKYDKAVQKVLEEKLMAVLPDAVFIGEEEDVHKAAGEGYAFVVDPIDGTTNFIKDYHASCISVGILKNKEPYIGVIYNPYLDEMYTAKQGSGAFLNGKRIHVSDKSLDKGLVVFGTAPYYEEFARKTFDTAFDYFGKCLDIRRSGSAALDMCSVATGRCEIYFEYRVCPWDICAGTVLVREAGGKVTTMDGKDVSMSEQCSVKATNGICE